MRFDDPRLPQSLLDDFEEATTKEDRALEQVAAARRALKKAIDRHNDAREKVVSILEEIRAYQPEATAPAPPQPNK